MFDVHPRAARFSRLLHLRRAREQEICRVGRGECALRRGSARPRKSLEGADWGPWPRAKLKPHFEPDPPQIHSQFADVYLAKWNGRNVAVKILKEKYRGQEGPNFDFDAEKEILAKLPSVRPTHWSVITNAACKCGRR